MRVEHGLGQHARTVFTRRQVWRDAEPPVSLLEAQLLTGRTHQIRVHLTHLGFPLAGDDKYGDFAWNKALAREGLKRMFLHAERLELAHPLEARRLTLESPLPRDLAQFLRGCERCSREPTPMPSPPRRFRLLAFDWDGTLADSTALIAGALQQTCREMGLPVPDDVAAKHVIGLGHRDSIRYLAPTLDEREHGRFAERFGSHYMVGDAGIPLFDGVREMLPELSARGFMLGIATGKSRRGLDRVLAQHGIAHHFGVSRCADEGIPSRTPTCCCR